MIWLGLRQQHSGLDFETFQAELLPKDESLAERQSLNHLRLTRERRHEDVGIQQGGHSINPDPVRVREGSPANPPHLGVHRHRRAQRDWQPG